VLDSYSYWTGFAWGLVVLVSFLGWGAAFARLAGICDDDQDWTLCACWGIAVLLAVGGILALLGLADRVALIALVLAGCPLTAAFLRPRLRRAPARDWGGILIFAVTLLVFYAPSVSSRDLEPYDDYLAYFPFAHRFLETGTLIEPFSLRRLLSYGGQSLLHAFTISVGSENGIHILDSGIGMMLVGGLVYRLFRAIARPGWAIAGSLAVLLVPISRHNAASQATGMALWIALFLTLKLGTRQDMAPRGWMALAGLLAAGLCSLRNTHIVAIAILTGALVISTAAFAKREEVTAPALSACLQMIAWAFVAIAPWALLSYRSSGSLLYPVFKGYQSSGVGSSLDTPVTVKLEALAHFIANPSVLFLAVPLFVAVVLLMRGIEAPFALAALALVFAVPLGSPLTDMATLFRYLQPVAWGSVLIAWGGLIVAAAHRKTAVVVALLMTPLSAAYAFLGARTDAAAVASLPAEIADRAGPFPNARVAEYRSLNAAIPAGASVYAILPAPSLLDYRTHCIFNADFIGFASPPPGMPFFRGPAELKKYLLDLGIGYIAYDDFDHPTIDTGYLRSWWRDRMASRKPDFAAVVPYVLNLMQNVDELAASEGIAFASGDLRLIRLTPDRPQEHRPKQTSLKQTSGPGSESLPASARSGL